MVFSSPCQFILLLSFGAVAVIGVPSFHVPPGPGMEFMRRATRQEFRQCLNDSGLTRDDLDDVPEPSSQPDPKRLCFVKCLAEATGIISKIGDVNVDIIKESTPPHLESSIVEIVKCAEKVGKISSCDDMLKLHKCIPKPSPPPPPPKN